ncbi:MAG: hypothetical protein JKY10_11060 [Cohaesibacteraceae bacterium]|nr:hypothetical protein [Cohaesibacteraceae bacterium]
MTVPEAYLITFVPIGHASNTISTPEMRINVDPGAEFGEVPNTSRKLES